MRFSLPTRSFLRGVHALSLCALLGLTACGGGSDKSSNSLAGRSYSGTLSGSATGSFSYTIQSDGNNAEGSARVNQTNYTLRGYLQNDTINLQFQGQGSSTGWITGPQSSTGMTGSYELSGNGTVYKGSASASEGSAGSNASSGSSTGASNGSSGGSSSTGNTSSGTSSNGACSTAVGTIITLSTGSISEAPKSCSDNYYFVWGSNATSASPGTLNGSCQKAMQEYSTPRTACYCYNLAKAGAGSALNQGDAICYVGF